MNFIRWAKRVVYSSVFDYDRAIAERQSALNAAKDSLNATNASLNAANASLNAAKASLKTVKASLDTANNQNRILSEKIEHLSYCLSASEKMVQDIRCSCKYLISNPGSKLKVPCNICGNLTDYSFSGKMLGKYVVAYFHCPFCGGIQTEEPYWIKEAYESPLSASDTGILWRNAKMADIVLAIISQFFSPNIRILEYAGGHGMLTRTLRDAGIDCRWYDKYASPTFARGFEDDGGKYNLAMAVEAIEHFTNPMDEFAKIFSRADSIFFSQTLLPEQGLPPDNWWYFCPEQGQHIQFYSLKTLEFIAEHFGKHLNFYGETGLFSSRKISSDEFRNIIESAHALSKNIRAELTPLTHTDMLAMVSRMTK